MASYNKVLLMGNMTRDPEITYTPSQVLVCKFGLAVNRKYKTSGGEEREDVLFVDCTAFGKTGENIGKYFTKGKPIFLESQLKMDSWDDKTTGQKRSKLYVIVDGFQFVGGRDGGGSGDSQPESAPRPKPGGQNAKPTPAEPPFPDENQFKEDDIPF